MKRFIGLGVAALATLAIVGAATGATGTTTYGPYAVTTTDGGCGGNQWANDTITRTFQVKKGPMVAGAATWRLTRVDRGTFVTMAGTSPGNCASNATSHGTTVTAGKTGKVHGRLAGVVTGGTYNPAATCTAACGTTSTFVSTYFGASAVYSCLSGGGSCTFAYKYRATKQGLTHTQWTDKGNQSSETFTGDISTS